MLRAYRRWWFPIATALLALPLVVFAVVPSSETQSPGEARELASPPPWPETLRDWVEFPSQIDAYWHDRFGLRAFMIHAYALLAHAWLDSGNQDVFVGERGQLYYRGSAALAQSAGLDVRPEAVARTVMILLRMQRSAATMGAMLVFASPPTASSVVIENLPLWARNPGVPTNYDLLLRGLADVALPTVDLRATLGEIARSDKVYFLHDTHWTPRGAMAAFNRIASATGHPDWQWPLSTLLPPTQFQGGDEARLLGLDWLLHESIAWPVLPEPARQFLGTVPKKAPPFEAAGARADGRTIAIVGDSFTLRYYDRLLFPFVAKVIWVHYDGCRFDWRLIEQARPNQIWVMPTERDMLCSMNASPEGL
jgi:alginate O-acetyltransferase complex protein AlgJ